MKFVSILSIALISMAILVNSANALKCHVCNSHENSDCGDPMWNEPKNGPRTLKTDKFLSDCPTDATICRKIFQTVRGEDSVIRSCGKIEHKSDCYQTVLEEYNTQVCQCKTDGCNGARPVDISLGLTMIAATVAAYMAY